MPAGSGWPAPICSDLICDRHRILGAQSMRPATTHASRAALVQRNLPEIIGSAAGRLLALERGDWRYLPGDLLCREAQEIRLGNLNVATSEHEPQTNLCCIMVRSSGNGSTVVMFITLPHLGHGVVTSVFAGEDISLARTSLGSSDRETCQPKDCRQQQQAGRRSPSTIRKRSQTRSARRAGTPQASWAVGAPRW